MTELRDYISGRQGPCYKIPYERSLYENKELRERVRKITFKLNKVLEALETMVEMVEMNGFIRDYAMEIAREAIEKARGEE